MRGRNSSRRVYFVPMVVSALVLAACDGESGPDAVSGPLSGKVTIDGSATVLPLNQAMAKAFHEANPAVQFAVDFSGTGGGFRKFCTGQLDIEAASRAPRLEAMVLSRALRSMPSTSKRRKRTACDRRSRARSKMPHSI